MKIITMSRSFLFVIALIACSSIAFGQKNKAVAAKITTPVKIDGKLTDWQDSLPNYDKKTLLSYTVANDDKNLYLVIKSSMPQNNSKIMLGGIDFSVNTSGKKKEGAVVTFPIIQPPAASATGQQRQRNQGETADGAQAQAGQRGQGTAGGQRPDMTARLKATLASSKEIKVKGFKEVPDGSISIYNEYSIKAFASFDEKNSYVYELSIPLQSIGLTSATATEIAYLIKVNGRPVTENGGFGGGPGGFGGPGGGGFGGGGFGGPGGGNFGGGQGNNTDFSLTEPTEFWGKYTIATK